MNGIIIIAEAGVNHNGDMEMARRMVAAAAEAGADYVKFQTAVPELVISSIAPKAKYQEETTGKEESQLEMCKAIHLPLSAYSELAAPHGVCRRSPETASDLSRRLRRMIRRSSSNTLRSERD